MFRRIRGLIRALPFAGLFIACAAGAETGTLVLETPVDVWDVTHGDVNGDGLRDIVAFCSDATADEPTKELAIFLAQGRGRFPSAPDLRYSLPSSNGTVILSEFDGTPPMEIVEFEHDRAVVSRIESGAVSRVEVVALNSLLPNRTREPVIPRRIATDLDGDGADEWIVPVPRGVAVYSRGRLRAEIPAPTSNEFKEWDNLAILHRLPAVTSFALPEEPLRAIALLTDRHANFSYGPEWSRHASYMIPQRDEETWDAASVLEDIDGNGYPDLVVTNSTGTVNLQVSTQIYLATGPFAYPNAPNAEFKAKGSFTTVQVQDVDGDGKRDMILVRIPLGVRNIISYLLRKRVSIEVAVHYFRDGKFDEKPDRTSNITIDAPDGREQAAYVTGDFDGDGRLDVAIGTDDDKLAIYRGTEESFLGSRPWITLDLPTFGVARIANLNDNDADDILLHHPSGESHRRIEVILF